MFLFFFSPFSIAITSLGEERANLSVFRTFVRFALVWFCLFPLPRCLGRAAACDCDTPRIYLLPFLRLTRTFLIIKGNVTFRRCNSVCVIKCHLSKLICNRSEKGSTLNDC